MEIDVSCLLQPDHGQNVALHCMADGVSHQLLNDPAWMGLLSDIVSAQPSALGIQNIVGDTALHVACRVVGTNALTVVRLLFQANSKAAMVPNNDGELPMHLASSFQPTEVVQFLIQESPTSVIVHDRGGNLPLHAACSGRNTIDNIKLLIDSCPTALTCKNEKKETPLHIACQTNASVRVIEYLIQRNREIVGWQDEDGCLPLHYVCGKYPAKAIFALMRLHMPLLPQLIMVKNRLGLTPIHRREMWFKIFSNRAFRKFEEENTIRETLDWMNTVTEALQPSKAYPGAIILLHWTKDQKEACMEKLSLIELELDGLVATYAQHVHDESMRRILYEWRNETLGPID
jgi:ankyrin repeat protein